MADLQRRRMKEERRLWERLSADCRRMVAFLRKSTDPVAYSEIPLPERSEPGADLRAQWDAERRKSGVLLACVDEGWVKVIGDPPGRRRYDFEPDTRVQLTPAGRRVRAMPEPQTESGTITVLVRAVGGRIEVAIGNELKRLTRKSGLLLLSLLATKRPCTHDDVGYAAENSLCQRVRRLRKELSALLIPLAIIDQAIVFQDGAARLSGMGVRFRVISQRQSLREQTNVKGLDQGKRLGGRRKQGPLPDDEE